VSERDLAQAVEEHHRSVDEFVKGNHEPLARLYSSHDDVTLGNPFGPFVRGPQPVLETMERAAALYREGEATGFDLVATYVAADLACFVEVERIRAKVGGRDDVSDIALRVTTVFRLEEGAWRLVHRHADPITAPRPAESIL
jgi:ketosteroid isomerase-like protein